MDTVNSAALCCHYGTDNQAAGYGINRGGNGRRRRITSAPKGIAQTVAAAVDNAVHGGDSGYASGVTGAGGGGMIRPSAPSGAQVIAFPMVNPYKPAVQTGVPIPGLTAPPRYTRIVRTLPDAIPDDQIGMSGLGLAPFDEGVYASNPTKLQTILGTIQATLPATIQALRAQPANIYPGSMYNPYATNAGGMYPGSTGTPGADIGASAGAAVGNVGDTIGGIVARHPYLVLAGGAALLLLFMNPPRRR